MLMCGENSVNVGEIYVMPQYRGTKLSEQLLNMAIKRAKQAGMCICGLNMEQPIPMPEDSGIGIIC